MDYNFVGGVLDVAVALPSGKVIEAKIENPSSAREVQHIKEGFVEVVDKGGKEETINHGTEADARLFDEIATFVKPIRLSHEEKGIGKEFRVCTPEVLSAIPTQWKTKFISAIRKGEVEVIEDEDEVVLGEDVITVAYYIPSKADAQYKIEFDVPTPGEKEFEKLESKLTEFVPKYRGGSRNNNGKFVLHIEKAVEAFDEKMKQSSADIRGGSVDGRTFKEAKGVGAIAVLAFLEAIRPSIKLKVLDAAMRHYQAQVRD